MTHVPDRDRAVERYRQVFDRTIWRVSRRSEDTEATRLTVEKFVLLIRSKRLKLLTTAPDSIPRRYRSIEDA